MKILHTSDWHLGRSFGPMSLHDVQTEFCTWVLQTALDHGVELLVVAGDLYDRAIPPQESVVLWRETLTAFHRAGIAVVAIAGNHDGADRVAAFDGLTDEARIFVRGGYERAGEVLALEFDDGPLDIVAVPFLDPQLAPSQWADELVVAERPRTHETVLDLALGRARTAGTTGRSLAVVHAFVAGSSESESERHLTVGGTDRIGAPVLTGFSYVALGHLHTPQVIGDVDHVRYSGTPLPYSFSETGSKSVVVVDMGPDGSCSIQTVPVPVGRSVATIVGTIDELLTPDAHVDARDKYVKAVLTDATYVADAKARLQELYPYCTDIVMQAAGAGVELGPGSEIRAQLPPLDAAEGFWSDVIGEPLTNLQHAALVEAVDRVFSNRGINR